MLITSSQIQWTADCTKALKTMKERGDKKGLKSMKKKQVRCTGKTRKEDRIFFLDWFAEQVFRGIEGQLDEASAIEIGRFGDDRGS